MRGWQKGKEAWQAPYLEVKPDLLLRGEKPPFLGAKVEAMSMFP